MPRRSGAAARATVEASRRTLAEITSERIRDDIITGKFKAGERLLLTGLAARYGVSMSPLREALAGLAAEQFVLFEGRHGFRVDMMSEEDLDDLTGTRRLIEADILRLALVHGDEIWESQVIAAFHQLAHTERRIIETGERGDPAWEIRNAAFHDAIASACPLRLLQAAARASVRQGLALPLYRLARAAGSGDHRGRAPRNLRSDDGSGRSAARGGVKRPYRPRCSLRARASARRGRPRRHREPPRVARPLIQRA